MTNKPILRKLDGTKVPEDQRELYYENKHNFKNHEFWFILEDGKIYPVWKYVYGSHIYGTNNKNSDRDSWLVGDHPSCDMNTLAFQELLNVHDIVALEMYFTYESIRDKYSLTISHDKLRKSISLISSNSWVKGKKKLIVSGDYDLNAGLKSIFHSMRILEYGTQIARDGKIHSWDRMNWILEDLWDISTNYQRTELWNFINSKYRREYLKLSSRFKEACPKDPSESESKSTIRDLMELHDLPIHNDFINDLLNIVGNKLPIVKMEKRKKDIFDWKITKNELPGINTKVLFCEKNGELNYGFISSDENAVYWTEIQHPWKK